MVKVTAADLFDPALRSIELHMQLGGRVSNPSDIAEKVLTTLDLLETLDTRPMEWLHVNYSEQRMGSDNKLPRSHPQMELSVEDGARKDDAGQFYASWGYSVSILGFLAGGDRRVAPFDLSVVDGDQDPRSGNSFRLSFDDPLNGGTLAILKDWTLESVLAYEELSRDLYEGMPNPRFSR